jgi:hypothetical protein
MNGNMIDRRWYMRYFLYILRWGLLAIPGAAFFELVQRVLPGVYAPMIVSQVALGAWVFFLDRWIFERGGR